MRSDPSVQVQIETTSADQTRALGRRLAALLRPGDVVVLSGDLGAGKTTLAQGIGAGLGVRGDVTSPTFVISRVHPSLVEGPPLVHVDAYRLHGGAELDDLDLDETLELAVTVVEWGDGLADSLSTDRVRVHLGRRGGWDEDQVAAAGAVPTAGVGDDPSGEPDSEDERRSIIVEAFGPRWESVDLADALSPHP